MLLLAHLKYIIHYPKIYAQQVSKKILHVNIHVNLHHIANLIFPFHLHYYQQL